MNILKALGFVEEKEPKSDVGNSPNNSGEVSHINQEVYKKSVELSVRNKTLLLLRKIDDIILNSVTNQHDIAQQVASLLVQDSEVLLVTIFITNQEQRILDVIAFAESSNQQVQKIESLPFTPRVSFDDVNNILIQASTQRTVKSSNTIKTVLTPIDTQTSAPYEEIKTVFVFPLLARNEVIGTMVVGMRDEEAQISPDERDLLQRLVGSVGIALYNGFLYDELKRTNDRLIQVDKLKDEFVSLASHELKTPMSAIKSYLWMVMDPREGALNEKQLTFIKRSYISVERLIKMVDEMLNISRIESGRINMNPTSIDMINLVDEVRDEVLPRANELGINIFIQPNETLPPVLADANKIKEVLINLIGNALKFTPRDGAITISFSKAGEMIETHVQDTGVGIDPADLSKLFQKFSMIPTSYEGNEESTGTGLGLYISRSIIQLHGGQIRATSQGKGTGTTFTFSLQPFSDAALTQFKERYKNSPDKSVELIRSKVV
ncbi:MAG: GAF domain-containing sensor histidine kinase [Patescibacteria group bacterium]